MIRNSVNKKVNKGTHKATPKAHLVLAGLTGRRVARQAKISPSTLSHYIAGRRRNRITQKRIWQAYRSLGGQEGLNQFWESIRRSRHAG